MAISDLTNEPIEITLAGRKLKIKQLTIKELFSPFETSVKNEYIANAQAMAETLKGKDKQDFMICALANVPKGEQLQQQANELMNSPNGKAAIFMRALNKCQVITEEEVAEIITASSPSELKFIHDTFIGDSADATPESEPATTSASADTVPEKKT
jgi:hypothetical protein